MLLLEFQSSPDPWMALRMLVYAGLLWQHLVREKRLLADGKLPPILPIVLYNGDPRWKEAVDLRDLIGLAQGSSLWWWQPGLRYHLIDEGAFTAGALEGRDGLPALLFRLENAVEPDQLVGVTEALLAWFARNPGFDTARAVLIELLGAAMAPLGKGVHVPEALMEVRNMLATRMERWREQWRQEGLQEGLMEGRQEGRQEGRRQGEAALLVRLLEQRFGALPGWAMERVLMADPVMLKAWSLRLLDGASLEAILAGG